MENTTVNVGIVVGTGSEKEKIVHIDKIRTPKQIYEQVKHLGYREEPTKALISTCKWASLHPEHCILIGLVLMYNEA